jgi:hypothetical protein
MADSNGADGLEPKPPSRNIYDLKGHTGRSDGCFQIDARTTENGRLLHFHVSGAEVVLEDKPDALIKKVTLGLGELFEGRVNGYLIIERQENGWNVKRTDLGTECLLENGSSLKTRGDLIEGVSMETSDPNRFVGTKTGRTVAD